MCAPGSFCKREWCNSWAGWFFVCGECRPCAGCLCNSEAIDGHCPPLSCPAQPTAEIRYLQGAFFNSRRLASASRKTSGVHVECVYHLSLEGSMFRELQLPALTGDAAAVASSEETRTMLLVQDQCETFSRAGVFEMLHPTLFGTARARMRVTYTSGSGNFAMNAQEEWLVDTTCQQGLRLHRSSAYPFLSSPLHLTPAPNNQDFWYQGHLSPRRPLPRAENSIRSMVTKSLLGIWRATVTHLGKNSETSAYSELTQHKCNKTLTFSEIFLRLQPTIQWEGWVAVHTGSISFGF